MSKGFRKFRSMSTRGILPIQRELGTAEECQYYNWHEGIVVTYSLLLGQITRGAQNDDDRVVL